MGKRVIAFDIGGTSIRCSTVENGRILEYFKVPTPRKNKKEFLERVDELVKKFNSSKIAGIGMGIAGVIEDGVVKNSPNIGLRNFDMKSYLQGKYKKKVYISNDVNCFALAEANLGVKSKNFLLIAFGTGVGGGIVIDGKTYRGKGYGAEFGHMYFGNEYWETIWQKNRAKIKKIYGDNILFKELVKKKSERSKKILDDVTESMGMGIASLISAFDPETVVIGGGIREAGMPFLNMVKKKVKKYSFLPKTTPIVWTALDHPGTMGASLLVE